MLVVGNDIAQLGRANKPTDPFFLDEELEEVAKVVMLRTRKVKCLSINHIQTFLKCIVKLVIH